MTSEAISEHLISKNFLGTHAPRPPVVLQACMFMHAYIDIHIAPLLKTLAMGLWCDRFVPELDIGLIVNILDYLTFCTEMSYVRQNVGINSNSG